MLHMVRGCRVPAPDALEEGFEQKERSFYANLHAEHIEQAMRAFLLRQKEELFFFLELPAAEDEEKKLREEWKKQNREGDAPLHRDVYYWDGITDALCQRAGALSGLFSGPGDPGAGRAYHRLGYFQPLDTGGLHCHPGWRKERF